MRLKRPRTKKRHRCEKSVGSPVTASSLCAVGRDYFNWTCGKPTWLPPTLLNALNQQSYPKNKKGGRLVTWYLGLFYSTRFMLASLVV